MAVSLHSAGVAHARALITAGKVDQNGAWSISAAEENALLGDPPNWSQYSKWFMGHDSAADPQTKAAWKYPFGKGGKVYRAALRAIASRASAEGASAISAAASNAIELMGKPKEADGATERAWAVLTIKSIDAEQRIISGIATSASTDRVGDIVEPLGAQFNLPIPLLWQHDSKQPIGEVFAADKTSAGIEIRARIAKVSEPGQLKDRLDMAWQSIKAGLVKGLSIGFKSLEDEPIKDTYGVRFLKWLWLELSAVTIPANADASILAIKSADAVFVKGAVAPHSTNTVDLPWDAPMMDGRLPDPMPMATAKAAYAYCDPSQKAALVPKTAVMGLHHMIGPDGAVGAANMQACVKCISDLQPKAYGAAMVPPADRAGVHAHVAKHMTDGGMTAPPLHEVDSRSAASGSRSVVTARSSPSGASDISRTVKMRMDRSMKKSYADQIASWEATRKAKTDRMDEILGKSADAGVTLDDAEQEEHDTLDEEVTKIDAQLKRLQAAEAREKASALPVSGRTSDEGGRMRAPSSVITVERKLPKGIAFARYAMCVGVARGNFSDATALARKYYPDDPGIVTLIEKTGVGAAATVTSHWADDLVPYNILNDFIEFLRPGSIVGKFGGPNPGGGPDYPSLNRVPFNVRVSGASAGLTANWVGEGLPALLSKMTTFNTTLTWAKVEALAVLTKEEIRFSNPSAEAKVRDDIARAVNSRIDQDFVDPNKGAVANVSPASITNAVAGQEPSGATAASLRTDLAKLIGGFATNNLDPSDIVLIMSASTALELSMMINTLGNPDFPDITMKGGTLKGFPVIVSEHMTALGSPKDSMIIAVKASDVYLADDGVVTIDASDQASLEMVDSSSMNGLTGTGSNNIVSLWQAGLLGLKAQREITWKLRRSNAVAYITAAAYKA